MDCCSCFQGVQQSKANPTRVKDFRKHMDDAQKWSEKLYRRRERMLKELRKLKEWIRTERDVVKGAKDGAAICAGGGAALLFFCPPAGIFALGYSGVVNGLAEAGKYQAEVWDGQTFHEITRQDTDEMKKLHHSLYRAIEVVAKEQKQRPSTTFDSMVKCVGPPVKEANRYLRTQQMYKLKELINLHGKISHTAEVDMSAHVLEWVAEGDKKLGLALSEKCTEAGAKVFANTLSKTLGVLAAAVTINDAINEHTLKTPTEAAVQRSIVSLDKSIREFAVQLDLPVPQ